MARFVNRALIFGGAFNPVHIGHMRLAIEALEMLGELVSRLIFLPASDPPHKKAATLLPFEMRARMIRASLAGIAGMECDDLEARLPGASYTFDTMEYYRENYRSESFVFLLGSHDFALLPQWRRGLELPLLCDLAVVPRGDFGARDFEALAISLWPGSVPEAESLAKIRHAGCGAACMKTPGGGLLYFLPIPHMPVSATRIRALWLAGRNVDYLVPAPALEILDMEKGAALARWRGSDQSC